MRQTNVIDIVVHRDLAVLLDQFAQIWRGEAHFIRNRIERQRRIGEISLDNPIEVFEQIDAWKATNKIL
ncbi:hypothetical protein D7Z26_13660 [Cohnella endophytica]|uniref:Uncharacterized protein n=1 Tax=Cohnella endophytica TaxID=2419778 RepID=A0A494XXE5_9BACL|nr:hypothetical protein D7Z26_13660 [Cohnella endophytica]